MLPSWMVAPRAGAWIETRSATRCRTKGGMSRPARARGLKHTVRDRDLDSHPVAPRAGAWIET